MAACGAGAAVEEAAAEKPKLKLDGLKDVKLKDVKTKESNALKSALLTKDIQGGAKLKAVPDDKKQHKDAPKTDPKDYVEAKEAEKK